MPVLLVVSLLLRCVCRFVPLPETFYFPHLYLLTISILLLGLVESSVNVIAAGIHMPGLPVAIVTLLFVGCYLLFTLAMVLHLWRQHRFTIYQPAEELSDIDKVTDPVTKVFQKMEGKVDHLFGRERGEYIKPREELREPQRTERILANPFCASRSADALAQTRTFASRGTGHALGGISYEWLSLFIGALIAVLAGVGEALTEGTSAADAQVGLTITLQFGFALFILAYGPGVDRLDDLATGLQFSLEGGMGAALLAGDDDSSFALSLAAIFIPAALQLYDIVIVSLIRTCSTSKEERLSFTEWLATIWATILAIVGVLFAYGDVDSTVLDLTQASSDAALETTEYEEEQEAIAEEAEKEAEKTGSKEEVKNV